MRGTASALWLVIAIAFRIAGAQTLSQPLPIRTADGRELSVIRVVQHFPNAVTVADAEGKVTMLRHVDLSSGDLAILKRLNETRELPPPAPEAAPRASVKIVNVGSKTSTSYNWRASWGSNIRTHEGASLNEARITLRTQTPLVANVITVIGDRFAVEQVQLVPTREVAVAMTEPSRTRKIYDLKALGVRYVVGKDQKPLFFVQVQTLDGVVIGEAGHLIGHEPGVALKLRR